MIFDYMDVLTRLVVDVPSLSQPFLLLTQFNSIQPNSYQLISLSPPPPVFSNILKKSQIERLAEVDEFEAVKEIQEFYGDYLAINNDLFTFNLTYPTFPVYGDSSQMWDGRTFQRVVEGLMAVLLSLKKRPLIRYEKNSSLGKRLAAEIQVHYRTIPSLTSRLVSNPTRVSAIRLPQA